MSGLVLGQPLEGLLHRWMPAQRWYPAKGRGVGLRPLSSWELPSGEDGARVEVLVVGLDSGDRLDVVQVPLVVRTAPRAGAEHALLGELPGEDGPRWLYDGPHDPAFVAALLASLEVPPGAPGVAPGPASVLSGEQSNTSVIVRAASGPPAIVKVFRTLHPGANPDVEVLEGLTRVGCDAVPALLGWSSGSWALPSGEQASGHLAVAVEFLAGSEDAWRVALAALRAGHGFEEQARGLGAAVAHVHLDLARAFGTHPVDAAARARSVEKLSGRVRWAADAVSELDVLRRRLEAHADSLAALPELPDLQRVHGDLHLGQVLHSPARGWALLDFEGEPLRPLSERVLPDLALRDVAGVLRSLAYAAGHDLVTGAGTPGTDPAAWATAARDAFCEGYGSVSGRDPREDAALLRALELDKALYEVVYEARNRPSWLQIPLRAVERLLP